MKNKKYKYPIFSIVARVRGGLQCSYVFESDEQFVNFLKKDFDDLCNKYGALSISVDSLPKLKIGDRCLCSGEGSDVLEILDIRKISDHRWSFALSHGCWEEVAKCYKKVK